MRSILDLSGSFLDGASDFKMLKLKGIFVYMYIYIYIYHIATLLINQKLVFIRWKLRCTWRRSTVDLPYRPGWF